MTAHAKLIFRLHPLKGSEDSFIMRARQNDVAYTIRNIHDHDGEPVDVALPQILSWQKTKRRATRAKLVLGFCGAAANGVDND